MVLGPPVLLEAITAARNDGQLEPLHAAVESLVPVTLNTVAAASAGTASIAAPTTAPTSADRRKRRAAPTPEPKATPPMCPSSNQFDPTEAILFRRRHGAQGIGFRSPSARFGR